MSSSIANMLRNVTYLHLGYSYEDMLLLTNRYKHSADTFKALLSAVIVRYHSLCEINTVQEHRYIYTLWVYVSFFYFY